LRAIKRQNVNTISELLISYREAFGLTQKDLVEKLVDYSSDFKNLNTVTVSRWETGTTSPSTNKKKRLLHFFASGTCLHKNTKCHDVVEGAYKQLYGPLSEVFTRNYQYLIGNFPEFEINDSHIYSLMTFSDKKAHIEHIIDIETVTNVPGYYSLTPMQLESLCNHPSSFAVVCARKKQHLGHFVMFKIKNSVAEEVVHHRKYEHRISMEDLCGPNEKGTYYVHGLYGKNPKIAALLNVYAYLYLFEHMRTTDNVLIFSSRKDGVLLTKDYGIKLIDSGVDESYRFKWHGLMSPVEDILFSDTVVKLIF